MVKRIELTQGKVALVDDEDYEWLSKWSWCYFKYPKASTGYASRTDRSGGKQRKVLMHREILHAGEGEIVDHRDMDGCNNVRSNLRLASKSQNNANRYRQKNTVSRYKGLFRSGRKRPWGAQITVDGRRIRIGYFDTEEEAAMAYDAAARKYFGEFARLNFPDRQTSLADKPSCSECGKRLSHNNLSGKCWYCSGRASKKGEMR
jgi:hypothetical protein